MIKFFKTGLTLFFIILSFLGNAQSATNNFRVFIGVGNNNLISDIITLTDNSFLGEISGQVRIGVRIYNNCELNFGVYSRLYPRISNYPGLTYNKFLGYSGSFQYEFRKTDSKWGIPLGVEFLKYEKNLDSALNDGSGKHLYDRYDAFAVGPKVGIRYHFSKHFFLESELEILYEHFKQDMEWLETGQFKGNTFSSFKFFGISANFSF